MKNQSNIKNMSALVLLFFFSTSICASSLAPYFSPRSQSVDLARQLVGVSEIVSTLTCSNECWPGYVGATVEFSKSFDSRNISQFLFGSSLMNDGCCQAISITGSAVDNRSSTDWLADYFGLPVDFQSVVNINPMVVNTVGDIQGYFRLDNWVCGLYFYIHAPITGTKWDMHMCEDVINTGIQDYPQGYFGPGTINEANLLHSFTDYISGLSVPNRSGTTPLAETFTETFDNLQYAR